MFCLILVAIFVCVLALYLNYVCSTFNQYGIKHDATVPFIGPTIKLLRAKEHIGQDLKNLYDRYPEERFLGRFELLKDSIVIRDIELLKKITIKDSEHFLDHTSNGFESLFERSLFFMQGQEWKDMRSTLSPAFTSSKIRQMVPFMVEVGDQMMTSLKNQIENSKDGYVDIDCKDLTTRYANDVIASCAFGLKVNSHTDKNNDFYVTGKTAFEFKLHLLLVFFLISKVPYLKEALNWSVLPKKTQDYFINLFMSTMRERELKKIVRPDMIHLLMEANKGKLSHEEVKSTDTAAGFATVEESSFGQRTMNRVWKDKDLVAQAFLFFVAGFETVSSSMCFIMHELAVHPDVQDRLVQEIREHDAKNGGKFTFDSILNMKYMDMVVSEVLRLWPPNVVLDRVCTKDYNMGKPNPAAEKDFIIRKGSPIMIPSYAFHHDAEFFPEPEKFDPERFSEENKHKINPMAYMPFGVGPRNCIGSRFALCELKVMLYQLLREMELSPCEKTCIPAKLDTKSFNNRLVGGHWLRFKPRN
nr:cytochrome P450 [Spodoptera frugiperda]